MKKQLDIIHVCDDIYAIDWLSAAQPKGKYYEAMDHIRSSPLVILRGVRI